MIAKLKIVIHIMMELFILDSMLIFNFLKFSLLIILLELEQCYILDKEIQPRLL